ncbi:MAG: hypothetical protein K8S99_10290 [Planctomycetes bacterium]|nr:hypothetical protein [Planctomycetota bacterium]
MKLHDIRVLNELVVQLQELDAQGKAECAISAESGLDEAILFGTPEGLIALATVLLRLARAGISGEPVDGMVPGEDGIGATDAIRRLFFEFGNVWPVCAMVAPDHGRYEELKKQLLGAE